MRKSTGSAATYMFVYGSLVSRASLERSLPGGLGSTSGPFPAHLEGYRRMWNVGSDVTSQPERRWIDSLNNEFHGVIASLGLFPERGSRCLGAVYRMPSANVGIFDARERDYVRTDVTGLVTLDGTDAVVSAFAYLPKLAATDVLEQAIEQDRAVASSMYISAIEDAFRSFGPEYLAEYRNTTPAPTFRIDALRFEPRV